MLTTLVSTLPFVFAPAPAAPCVFQRCDPCLYACMLPPPDRWDYYCDDAYECATGAYQTYWTTIIACNGNYWCCEAAEEDYVWASTVTCPALCEADVVWCQLSIPIPEEPPEDAPQSEWNIYWCQLGVSAAANLEMALCGCCDEACCEAVYTSVPLRWANCRNGSAR